MRHRVLPPYLFQLLRYHLFFTFLTFSLLYCIFNQNQTKFRKELNQIKVKQNSFSIAILTLVIIHLINLNLKE